jgi:hypothetical protein
MRDTRHGIETGRFHIENPHAVRVLLSGAFIAIMSERVEGNLDDVDLDDTVEHILRLFGLDNREAHDIAHRPLSPLAAASGDAQP